MAEKTLTGIVSEIYDYSHGIAICGYDYFLISLKCDDDKKKIVIQYKSEDSGMLEYLYQTLNCMHSICKRIKEFDKSNKNLRVEASIETEPISYFNNLPSYRAVGLPKILNQFYQ